MDPNLRIYELSDAQLTSCTLFEGLLSPYITHRFFCQPGSWLLSINLVSKIGEPKKGKFNFLLFKFSQKIKQETSVMGKKKKKESHIIKNAI